MYEHILSDLLSSKWLISEEYLMGKQEFINNLLFNPELLGGMEKKLKDSEGRSKGRDLTITEDGIAIIDINGPIYRHSDIGFCSSTQSTESISRDLKVAVNDSLVKGIIIKEDTPGGDSRAVSELSDQIKAVRGIKPIYSYIEGTGASAGYWFASATEKIYANKTAFIGSIGAVMEFHMMEMPDNIKKIQIVSKQSPDKRFDLESEKGQNILQTHIDDLAQEFVEDVAANRGVSVDFVLENYGKGGTMIGKKAVEAGLADEIGTLETVIEDMKKEINLNGGMSTVNNNTIGGLSSMSNTEDKDNKSVEAADLSAANTQAVADARAEAKAEEKNRVKSITDVFASNELSGHAKMTELVNSEDAGKMEALEACMEIMKATAKEAKPEQSLAEKELAAIAADANDLPETSNSSEDETESTNMSGLMAGFKSVKAHDMG